MVELKFVASLAIAISAAISNFNVTLSGSRIRGRTIRLGTPSFEPAFYDRSSAFTDELAIFDALSHSIRTVKKPGQDLVVDPVRILKAHVKELSVGAADPERKREN